MLGIFSLKSPDAFPLGRKYCGEFNLCPIRVTVSVKVLKSDIFYIPSREVLTTFDIKVLKNTFPPNSVTSHIKWICSGLIAGSLKWL